MAKQSALRKTNPAVAPEQPQAAAAAHVLEDLDKLIHERLRLGIVSALAASPSLAFTELKNLLRTTDGNLSVHARKLEDAGYIECTKGFEGRMPRTEYRISELGRRALGKYLDHMEALIHAMRER